MRRVSFLALMIAALAVASAASGCSWLFVDPLVAIPERGDRITCTTSRLAPIVDTFFATTNVATSLYVATQDDGPYKGAAIALGLSEATLWALSAGYGYWKTAECQNAKEGVFDTRVPDPRTENGRDRPGAHWSGAPTPPPEAPAVVK